MRALISAAAVLLLVTAVACAPKTVAVVPVGAAPRFPDFVRPTVPADLAQSPAAASQDLAWVLLQRGDIPGARREVMAALESSPDFYPAETLSGYVGLAVKDDREALAMFTRALVRRGDYAPALAGKGEALLGLAMDGDAIEAFQAAVVADPSLVDVQRKLDVLRFRTVQNHVTAGRQAAGAGRFDEARQAYRTAIGTSPESAFLYRELAGLERDHGSGDLAIEYFRRATTLDPLDGASFVDLAEMLEARNEFDASLEAYAGALSTGHDPAVTAKRDALRQRAEAARLPTEYRAIASATQVTRGDLAALIAVRLPPLLQTTRPRDMGVMTDIGSHWAQRWILSTVESGIMDPYENHTFQPRSLLQRVDFAQVVARLLMRVASVAPAEAVRWQNASGRFADLAQTHMAFPAVSAAVAAGVIAAEPGGLFQPTRLVTGPEAIAALERLRSMAGAAAAGPRP